ncbi:hypothetical protein [Peribacillus butanolivorans]|uniref:hypothetical protein n=1 Tax=Peribacillus butanolivorans TaxID=421767 RepID=UPI003652CEFE
MDQQNKDIQAILAKIEDINLFSLNASIEATRAGEHAFSLKKWRQASKISILSSIK